MTTPSTATPPPVSEEARRAFSDAADSIIADTVTAALAETQDVIQHGDDAARLVEAGLRWTTRGLEVAMTYGTSELLRDQMAWAAQRLPHDGVAPEHVLRRLRLYEGAVSEHLDPAHATEVNRWVDWMIAFQEQLVSPTDGG